jgi:transposase
LADLSFPSAAQHIALQEYRDAIDEIETRIDRLTEQVRQLVPTWRWAPLVAALQALRGVSFVTAVALVAELGDLTRFGHPRELMAYLGLVPSECWSDSIVRSSSSPRRSPQPMSIASEHRQHRAVAQAP